jgi:hypothetical protein
MAKLDLVPVASLLAAVAGVGCGGYPAYQGGGGVPSVVLTIQQRGVAAAVGTIGFGSGGTSLCVPACQMSLPYGTDVVLTAAAQPRSGAWFLGWSGACAGNRPTCTVHMSGDQNVIADFQPANYMFVTSQPVALPLGAATADVHSLANNLCAAAAAAATPTPLPETRWVAWISTAGLTVGGAVSALAALGTAGGWMRPDGQPFANTTADLLAGGVLHPARVTENGDQLASDALVTTGSGADGAAAGLDSNCQDWTSAAGMALAGEAAAGGATWTASPYRTSSCAPSGRLYCFGIDYDASDASVAAVPVAGRTAFLSKGLFTPGGAGRAVADKLCQDEADASTLAARGTYLALLAGDGQAASTRFDLTGAAWTRVDGVALAARAGDLVDTGVAADDLVLSTLNMHSDGTTQAANASPWTGASGPDQPGTADTTCGDWQSADGAAGVQGDATIARARSDLAPSYFDDGAAHSCALARPVYCLQT